MHTVASSAVLVAVGADPNGRNPTAALAQPPPGAYDYRPLAIGMSAANGVLVLLLILLLVFGLRSWSRRRSANSYWVGLMGYSTANMNQAFADIAKAGGTTVRTW